MTKKQGGEYIVKKMRESKLTFKRKPSLIKRVGVIAIAVTIALSISTVSSTVNKVSPSSILKPSVINAETEVPDEELIDLDAASETESEEMTSDDSGNSEQNLDTENVENDDKAEESTEESFEEDKADLITPEDKIEGVPESEAQESEQEPDSENEVDANELAGLVEMTKGYDPNDYTEDSYDVLSASLKMAENLLVKDDLNQDHVDSASIALETAIDGLVESESETEVEDESDMTVDTSEIEELIQEANGYNAADYTEASFANLQGAIQVSDSLIGKAEVNQEEVDVASKQIENAIKALNELEKTEPESDAEKEAANPIDSESEPEAEPESDLPLEGDTEASEPASEPEVQTDESNQVTSIEEENVNESTNHNEEIFDSVSSAVEEPAQAEGSRLPNTATSTYNMILVGFVVIIIGGLGLLFGRRNKVS